MSGAVDEPRSGSSPLARGLLPIIEDRESRQRIIPARAGFTGFPHYCSHGYQDHPRSRGVYASSRATRARPRGSSPLARGLPPAPPRRPWPTTSAPGSSPLARGLLECARPLTAELRIIPARAGFTSLFFRRTMIRPDHPRSRGVYGGRTGQGAGHARIIPARAGFTSSSKTASLLDRDHPRSRGVYAAVAVGGAEESGSSPLARGLHMICVTHPLERGIIPARAGFTNYDRFLYADTEDHPRSRGVYSRSSSKRCSRLWIIPARAGFTQWSGRETRREQDHPRSRGVYVAFR